MMFSRPKTTAFFVFLSIFIFLFINNKYYVPTNIDIVGTYSKPVFLHYCWDSGAGYNKYEENNVWLGNYIDFNQRNHLVEIGLVSDNKKRGKVFIKNIYIKKNEKSGFRKVYKEKFELRNDYFKINLEFSKIMFSFQNDFENSEIFIKIDNELFNVILPNEKMISIIKVRKFIPGYAKNKLELPRLKIDGIRIRDYYAFKNKEEQKYIEFSQNISNKKSTTIHLNQLKNKIHINGNRINNTKNNLVLVFIHLFLSLLAGYLFFELMLFINQKNLHNWKTIFSEIIFGNNRWVFLVIFFVTFMFFSFWLFGQWPAEMNWDSFVDYQRAQALSFNNNHSFMYLIIIAGLIQIFNSPAIVPIFQIFLMSGLTAWIFYFALKNNVEKKWLFCSYLLLITSVPIGLNTILVNTSTFFAILLLFWGFYLFRLSILNRMGIKINFSNRKIFILAFMFYLLISIRHNGMIYVVFLPMIIYFINVLSKKVFLKFLSYFLIIFLSVHFGFGSLLNVHKKTHYKLLNLSYKIPAIVYFFVNKDMYYSKNPDKDINIINQVKDIDYFTKNFHIRSFQKFYSRLKKELINNEKKINNLFFRSVLNNIPLYFAYRTQLFFEILGASKENKPYYLNAKKIESIKRDRPINLRNLINKPIISIFEKIQKKILNIINEPKNFFKYKFWFWNTGFQLMFLFVLLFLYKLFPLTAYISLLALVQIPFLFLTIPTVHWRYLYFIYLLGYYILPFVFIEYKIAQNGTGKKLKGDACQKKIGSSAN